MHADRRIEYLTDSGSFKPCREPGTAAFITGTGTIEGYSVVICATETRLHQNVDIIEGIGDYIQALKMAGEKSCPFVLLLDSGPRGDSSKQLESLNPEQLFLGPGGMGELFMAQARLAGRVPRLGAVLGPVAASRSFMVSLCDCVAFVRGTGLATTSPAMIKQITGETTDFWQLGGADIHFNRTGIADVLSITEEDALNWLRRALVLLVEPALSRSSTLVLEDSEMIPGIPFSQPPMRQLIKYISDEDSVLELKSGYRLECITALARVEGRRLGIIANNAQEGGGVIHGETCEKMIAFIELCDSHAIPMLFLVDTPGFMMGRDSEWKGIIRSGGALFTRLAKMRTPYSVVVANKAFSTGLYAMGGGESASDKVSALPGAALLFYGDRLLEFYLETPFISEEERAALTLVLHTAGFPEQLVERGRIHQVLELPQLRAHAARFLQAASPKGTKAPRLNKKAEKADAAGHQHEAQNN